MSESGMRALRLAQPPQNRDWTLYVRGRSPIRAARVISAATAIVLATVVVAFTAALADANPSARVASTTATGQPGVHWDAHQCAPYGSVSPYAYTCPCAYTYDTGYEYSYGYGYACAPEAGVRVLSKHSVRPKPAPAAKESTAPTTTTTVAEPASVPLTGENAEPASLPFTGENAVLVAVLGAGVAGLGVLVRRRAARS